MRKRQNTERVERVSNLCNYMISKVKRFHQFLELMIQYGCHSVLIFVQSYLTTPAHPPAVLSFLFQIQILPLLVVGDETPKVEMAIFLCCQV